MFIRHPKKLLLVEIYGRLARVGLFASTVKGVELVEGQQIQILEEESIAEEQLLELISNIVSEEEVVELAVIFPQNRCISQVIELSEGIRESPDEYFVSIVSKQSGISSESIFLRSKPLKSFGRYKHPYWVSWCKRDEIENLLIQLGVNDPTVSSYFLKEVVPTSELLFAWSQTVNPSEPLSVWVYCDENYTTLVIRYNGQIVFATAFSLSLEGLFKRDFSTEGIDKSPSVIDESQKSILLRWVNQLERNIEEWKAEAQLEKIELQSIPVYISGIVLDLDGVASWIVNNSRCKINANISKGPFYESHFAFAKQCLENKATYLSFLPDPWIRQKRIIQGYRKGQLATIIVVIGLFLSLTYALGYRILFQKELVKQINRVQQLLTLTTNTLQYQHTYLALINQLTPLVSAGNFHMTTLNILEAIKELNLNPENEWAVTFCDLQTYLERTMTVSNITLPSATNAWIVELCLKYDENTRPQRTFEIIERLSTNKYIESVDLLPPNLTNPLASTNIAELMFLETVVIKAKSPLLVFSLASPKGRQSAKGESTNLIKGVNLLRMLK